MAHYAYNTLKIPAEWGVLTIKADIKDAVFCVEQIYKAAAVFEPAAEPPGSQEDEPGGSTPEGCYHCARLPSGPKNAAAITSRAANNRLPARPSNHVEVKWQYLLVVQRRLGYVSFLKTNTFPKMILLAIPPMDKGRPFHQGFSSKPLFCKNNFGGVHLGTL